MDKREEQRLRREQKQKAAERNARVKGIAGKIALIVIAPLVLITIVYSFLGQGEIYAPDEVGENEHVRGNPDADVTLVVYADFQCPACAREHQITAQAWPRISNQVQLVFRHYPLSQSHPHAWAAASYAEAAGLQGSFWPMHDLLFANQSYWAQLSRVEEEFDGYLEQLGLDVAQAHEDIQSNALRQKIRNDQQGGTRAGVRSTPALFVNGRLTPVPRDVASMIRLVNEAAN